jgi:1,4-alpha-glucan branching enzyme
MAIEKKYLKTKPVCKVKFILDDKEANGAKKVNLVGDFNKWDKDANLMRKQKNGTFATTLDLEKDKEYEFRYVIDDEVWQNDTAADKYHRSSVGDAENSVVIV